MRMTLTIAAAAFLLGACASPTTTASAAPEGRDCFRSDDVNGFGLVDDYTVRVSVGPNRDYALATQTNVRQLRFDQTLGLRARPTGWICTGDGAGVEIFGGEPIERSWLVASVTRLPPENAAQGS